MDSRSLLVDSLEYLSPDNGSNNASNGQYFPGSRDSEDEQVIENEHRHNNEHIAELFALTKVGTQVLLI